MYSFDDVSSHDTDSVQICQKSRRIRCVIPLCNLQRAITQPIVYSYYRWLQTQTRRGGEDAPNIWHFVLLLLLASSPSSSIPLPRRPRFHLNIGRVGRFLSCRIPGAYDDFTGLSDDNDIFFHDAAEDTGS